MLPKAGQTVINSTFVFQLNCGASAELLSLEAQPSAIHTPLAVMAERPSTNNNIQHKKTVFTKKYGN